MNVIFDLDGTLLDTREAVERAYAEAGYREPIPWGQTASEWCDPNIHAKKVSLYPSFLQQYARPLPCLEYAVALRSRVITGASREAVMAVKQFIAPRQLNIAMSGLTRFQKVSYLQRLEEHAGGRSASFYVDDDEDTRITIERSTRWWQALSPEDFLASFSLQELMSGSRG